MQKYQSVAVEPSGSQERTQLQKRRNSARKRPHEGRQKAKVKHPKVRHIESKNHQEEGTRKREPNQKRRHQKSEPKKEEGKEREEPQQKRGTRRVGVTKDEHKKKERAKERGEGARDYIIVLSFQGTFVVPSSKNAKIRRRNLSMNHDFSMPR